MVRAPQPEDLLHWRDRRLCDRPPDRRGGLAGPLHLARRTRDEPGGYAQRAGTRRATCRHDVDAFAFLPVNMICDTSPARKPTSARQEGGRNVQRSAASTRPKMT